MLYVHRGLDGKIDGTAESPQIGWSGEELAESDPEVQAFFAGPPPTYRQLRATAYRDNLGKQPGDYIITLGDVLDVVIAQVETMRQALTAPATPDFQAMLAKIQTIKQEFPPT